MKLLLQILVLLLKSFFIPLNMKMALKMELPPLMQDSNFKNLELYALDFGITSLNIHDSFRYEVGHYDAIASTLQN